MLGRILRGRRERELARIDEYEFGRIVVDGQEERRDVIILPDRIVRNWWRKDGHSLIVEDFGDVLDELPGHLVVGTGASGRMRPDREAIRELEERGVKVESMPTPEAVHRYLELDPAATAAALHLTC
jgi:hypothetical protein